MKEIVQNVLILIVSAAITIVFYNVLRDVINALDLTGIDFIDIAHDDY